MIIKGRPRGTVLKTVGNLGMMFSCLFLFSCASGQLPQAVEQVTEVKQSKPVETVTYIELEAGIESDFQHAVGLMENGEYASAVKKLESIISREQRLIAPFINIAIAYRKIGNTEKAEENLNKALKMDPLHPVVNNELGLIYRKAGKFNKARESYQKVIANYPAFAAAKRNLGVLCDLYLHDFECALEQFENYLELNPDDKNVPIWIADVKQRAGNNQ
jgi:tetratricopeptide (TPR) repeat protein